MNEFDNYVKSKKEELTNSDYSFRLCGGRRTPPELLAQIENFSKNQKVKLEKSG
ncbi:MAG: hypothetical protein LBD23_15910 [Oscillospiraceae bacterium]|jgi:hypothetical protein|nr:hypothetical protein [Oscillospiraceae bacterium]